MLLTSQWDFAQNKPCKQTFTSIFSQHFKGQAMIFAGQKTPFIIFRSKKIYYLFQNK